LISKLKKITNSILKQKTHNINHQYQKIAIYSGEKAIGISHFNLWLPIFDKYNIDYIIIIREKTLFNELKRNYPQTTIIYSNYKYLLYRILKKFKSLKAIFYMSNIGNNIDIISFLDIKHIFIGHGDSDKTASAHKFFRVYDENWVASDASIDRFKNADFNIDSLVFKKIGRPNLEDTLTLFSNSWKDRFNGNIKALYLSTWEGSYSEQNYTSVYIINELIESILKLDINTLDIKLHPFLGKRDNDLKNIKQDIKKLSEKYHIKLYPKNEQISDIIQKYNIFICDISAVVTDSLVVNAPIFVYIPKNKNIDIAKSKMTYQDYTYTFSDIKELSQKLNTVLKGNDYLQQKREEAMEYILGKSYIQNKSFYKYLKDNDE